MIVLTPDHLFTAILTHTFVSGLKLNGDVKLRCARGRVHRRRLDCPSLLLSILYYSGTKEANSVNSTMLLSRSLDLNFSMNRSLNRSLNSNLSLRRILISPAYALPSRCNRRFSGPNRHSNNSKATSSSKEVNSSNSLPT